MRESRKTSTQTTPATNVSQSGDGVASNSETMDEVARSNERSPEETGQSARSVAERPQPVDLLGDAPDVRRRT